MLVPGCWEALMLGCNDIALGFCLEVSRLVGKLELYELSTSFSSGQVQPVHIRFGVVHLVHCQELPSGCIKFGQLL